MSGSSGRGGGRASADGRHILISVGSVGVVDAVGIDGLASEFVQGKFKQSSPCDLAGDEAIAGVAVASMRRSDKGELLHMVETWSGKVMTPESHGTVTRRAKVTWYRLLCPTPCQRIWSDQVLLYKSIHCRFNNFLDKLQNFRSQ